MLKPKLFTTLKNYSWSQFRTDSVAGIIVGVVAFPLAIAFAIASGVSPDKGLVTAVIAGLIISGLGGSRVQIGGPTGAFVVIVYSVIQKFGMDGFLVATMMGGVILVIMGVFRFGSIIKFIPQPGHRRFYERHRGHYLFLANPGLFRPDHVYRPGAFRGKMGRSRAGVPYT